MAGKLQHYVRPMLATETKEAFSDDQWIYEIKWDGYRAIAELKGSTVRLYSRNGLSFNETYPQIAEALGKLKLNAVLDGEIVALDDKGRPHFQLLQQFKENPQTVLQFQVFDLLYKDGHSLEEQPLLWRKQLLKNTLKAGGLIKYCDHIRGDGERFFREAVSLGQEGVMGKKADSVYQEGARTRDWLKIKNRKEEEAIILGYTEPAGKRTYFGSLVLGRYKGNALEFAGQVGTGFNEALLEQLYKKMQPLIRKTPPLITRGLGLKGPVTWIRPTLVCSIRFTEKTSNGQFRHPVFVGLRIDKTPKEVV
jgi:bifunctional non-homologous end joining protein LigD